MFARARPDHRRRVALAFRSRSKVFVRMPRVFALIVPRASVLLALALLVGCGSREGTQQQSGEIGKRSGKIAYTAFRCGPGSSSSPDDIYVVNADGSGERWLAHGSSPAWSPSGTTIAFAREGGHGLAVVGPNGTGLKTLVPGRVSGPAWSPDGRRIAFAMSMGRGESAIYVRGANGHISRLTEPRGYASPTWSPDGVRIAFHRLPSRESGLSDWAKASIYTIKTDGSDRPRQLGPGGEPDWSANGEDIAFTKFGPPYEGPAVSYDVTAGIYVMNSGGGERRRLTTAAPEYSREASWSPDGKDIVFASDRAGGLPDESDAGPFDGIWVMSADGSSPSRIRVNEYGCRIGEPDWQPPR